MRTVMKTLMTPAEGEPVIQIKPWCLCTLHQWVGADLQLSEADSTKPAAESGVQFQNLERMQARSCVWV